MVAAIISFVSELVLRKINQSKQQRIEAQSLEKHDGDVKVTERQTANSDDEFGFESAAVDESQSTTITTIAEVHHQEQTLSI